MVSRMLQLASPIPRKRFDRENEKARSMARRPLPLKRLRQFQDQTPVAVRQTTLLACGAVLRSRGFLVSRLLAKSETDTRRISFIGGSTRRPMSIEPLHKQRDSAQVAVRTRPSLVCATWQGQAGYVVRQMRKPAEAESVEAGIHSPPATKV